MGLVRGQSTDAQPARTRGKSPSPRSIARIKRWRRIFVWLFVASLVLNITIVIVQASYYAYRNEQLMRPSISTRELINEPSLSLDMLADYDGDGDIDIGLLASNQDAQHQLSIFTNDGTNEFKMTNAIIEPYHKYSFKEPMVFRDLNGDKFCDLIARNGSYLFCYCSGNGQLANSRIEFHEGASTVRVIDFPDLNKDGCSEILCAFQPFSQYDPTISLCLILYNGSSMENQFICNLSEMPQEVWIEGNELFFLETDDMTVQIKSVSWDFGTNLPRIKNIFPCAYKLDNYWLSSQGLEKRLFDIDGDGDLDFICYQGTAYPTLPMYSFKPSRVVQSYYLVHELCYENINNTGFRVAELRDVMGNRYIKHGIPMDWYTGELLICGDDLLFIPQNSSLALRSSNSKDPHFFFKTADINNDGLLDLYGAIRLSEKDHGMTIQPIYALKLPDGTFSIHRFMQDNKEHVSEIQLELLYDSKTPSLISISRDDSYYHHISLTFYQWNPSTNRFQFDSDQILEYPNKFRLIVGDLNADGDDDILLNIDLQSSTGIKEGLWISNGRVEGLYLLKNVVRIVEENRHGRIDGHLNELWDIELVFLFYFGPFMAAHILTLLFISKHYRPFFFWAIYGMRSKQFVLLLMVIFLIAWLIYLCPFFVFLLYTSGFDPVYYIYTFSFALSPFLLTLVSRTSRFSELNLPQSTYDMLDLFMRNLRRDQRPLEWVGTGYSALAMYPE